MTTLNELKTRALVIAAGQGIEYQKSPVVNNGLTIEALIPHAARLAIRRILAAGGSGFRDVSRTHTITISVLGVGTLPTAALREYLHVSAYLPEEPKSSYLDEADYNRSRFNNLLGYWTVRGDIFKTTCLDNVPSVKLTCVSTYDVPATGDTDLGIGRRLADETVAALVDALKGSVRVGDLLAN